MIYAEKVGDTIEDRGVFFSMLEFLPFREKGWASTPAINAEADARIAKLKATSERVLKYFAPMLRAGEYDRYELDRRLQKTDAAKEKE